MDKAPTEEIRLKENAHVNTRIAEESLALGVIQERLELGGMLSPDLDMWWDEWHQDRVDAEGFYSSEEFDEIQTRAERAESDLFEASEMIRQLQTEIKAMLSAGP